MCRHQKKKRLAKIKEMEKAKQAQATTANEATAHNEQSSEIQMDIEESDIDWESSARTCLICFFFSLSI
jgi:hypothetical protein